MLRPARPEFKLLTGADRAQQTLRPSEKGEVAEGRQVASTGYAYWVHQGEVGQLYPRHFVRGDGARPAVSPSSSHHMLCWRGGPS